MHIKSILCKKTVEPVAMCILKYGKRIDFALFLENTWCTNVHKFTIQIMKVMYT